MDRFQQPNFEPETLEQREAEQFSWYQIRKAAKAMAEREQEKDEDVIER